MNATDALQIFGFFMAVSSAPKVAAGILRAGVEVPMGLIFHFAASVTLVTWPLFVG